MAESFCCECLIYIESFPNVTFSEYVCLCRYISKYWNIGNSQRWNEILGAQVNQTAVSAIKTSAGICFKGCGNLYKCNDSFCLLACIPTSKSYGTWIMTHFKYTPARNLRSPTDKYKLLIPKSRLSAQLNVLQWLLWKHEAIFPFPSEN